MEAAAAPASPLPRAQEGGFIAKLGAWLQLAQVIGVLCALTGMMRALHSTEDDGLTSPEKFSVAIGDGLVFTFSGLALSLAGVVLITLAITAFRYRAMWMYYFLWCYGLLSLVVQTWASFKGFHLALAGHVSVGLFFIVFAMVKRQEFLRAGVRHALADYALEE